MGTDFLCCFVLVFVLVFVCDRVVHFESFKHVKLNRISLWVFVNPLERAGRSNKQNMKQAVAQSNSVEGYLPGPWKKRGAINKLYDSMHLKTSTNTHLIGWQICTALKQVFGCCARRLTKKEIVLKVG